MEEEGDVRAPGEGEGGTGCQRIRAVVALRERQWELEPVAESLPAADVS